MSLQPESCLMAYRSTSNVFFRDLPVSSFVLHLSLLTVKSVILVVAFDGFLYVAEIVRIFHSGYLDYRGTYQTVLNSYCCVTSWQRRAMDTSVLDDNWGTQHHRIFIIAILLRYNWGTKYDVECMGSILLFAKKLTN